jgi:MtrB/PioB family decaheme-associated outer membrane protein
MKPKLLSVLVASLFVPGLVQGQDQPQKEVSGSVSLGVRQVGISANDPSKFNEYRDLPSDTSLFGGFELRRRGDNDYLNAYGENIGREDQYLDLNGGRYGTFKYRLFSDQLRHNFGSGPGARTPFTGAGTDTLTFPGTTPNQNPATWNTFDHSYQRHNFGGFVELQATSPWYFRVDANEVKRDGINVLAGAKGTSPGNGFMDLPTPIDYTAQNLSGEVGFSNKTSHFAVNLLRSTFDNGHDVLHWKNDLMGPSGAILDTTVLPPSNQLTRLGINGNVRGLAMDSTLAGRYTYTTLTNDVTMQQTMLDMNRPPTTTPATPATVNLNDATNPSSPNFHGDHRRTTLGLSLASRPTRNLDTRLFSNYDKLQNNSTDVTFNPGAGTGPGSGLRAGSTDPRVNCANVAGVLCEPEMFHYTKKNFGLEAGYRLAREHKLLGGIDTTHTDRERADFPRTRENRFFGEYKAGLSDTLSGRIKYQYLTRRSDFEANESVLAANPIDLYVRRFDLANANQHLVKLVLDQNLANQVDLGFEMILKQNKYPDTPLGRTKDNRQEFYGSVGWGDPNALRLLVFGDIEYVTYDSNHRNDSNNVTGTNPALANPASGNTTTLYNWSARNKDTSWQIGVGADWKPRERLKLKSSVLYTETNGRADFAVQPGGAPGPFLPITNFDNTRRVSLVLRGVYDVSKQVEVTGGYSYEHYRYSDIGYDNTRYIAGTGTSAAYTTGQFAFQPYSANILFAMAKYKF